MAAPITDTTPFATDGAVEIGRFDWLARAGMNADMIVLGMTPITRIRKGVAPGVGVAAAH